MTFLLLQSTDIITGGEIGIEEASDKQLGLQEESLADGG